MSGDNNKDLSALTPMLQQYFQLKTQAGDAVLFFRMGDFYEVFGDDAEVIAPILDIVLTSRERSKEGERIPFCGVPHHSAKGYIFKLLSKGFKVAIADQMEDSSAAKGLVRREVTKIMTPGCIDELEGLDPQQANYLMAIHEDSKTKLLSVVLADISTGEFKAAVLRDFSQFITLLETYEPKEIICRRFFEAVLKPQIKNYLAVKPLAISYFNEHILASSEEQKKILQDVFGTHEVGFLSENPQAEVLYPVVAGVLNQIISQFMPVQQFLTIRPLLGSSVPVLDEYALRDLEIFESQRRRQVDGSLYQIINKTVTPMGTRLLRRHLAHPLTEEIEISSRLEKVELFLKVGEMELGRLRGLLKGMGDLERLAIRLGNAKVTPVELAKVKQALTRVIDFLLELNSIDVPAGNIENSLKSLGEHAKVINELLASALQDEVGVLGSGGQVFRSGFSDELDSLIALATDGSSKVNDYAEKLKQETGISSLKIREHKTFGLLIEVTRTHLNKVPAYFLRKQTMVNNERFTTPELKELEEILLGASTEAAAVENDLYVSFVTTLSQYGTILREIAEMIAQYDTHLSLAWLALKHNLVRPVLSKTGNLTVKGGRHLVVEAVVGAHAFTPNDINLERSHPQALITGPNMAGKSTYMRQIAVIAIMAQMGSFVPAFSAEVPVFDRIFTRVGASDDLSLGQSTFMVEMTESARILREATENSLVILDEVGRGTSTSDGMALAAGILDNISRHIKCYCLFSTHYHELVSFSKALKTLKLLRADVLETPTGIEFTHNISTGFCDSSFGLEVARLAGIPDLTLKKAKEFLRNMEQMHLGQSRTETKGKGVQAVLGALSESPEEKTSKIRDSNAKEERATLLNKQELLDLEIYYQLKTKLINLPINRTTPLQALNILADFQQNIVEPPAKTQNFFENNFFRKPDALS